MFIDSVSGKSLKKYGLKPILIFSAFSLVACANEDAVHFKNPKIALGNSDCLDSVGVQMDDYIDGVASASDVREVVGCFAYVVTTFGKYVQGAVPGRYTPQELRRFLEVYFLNQDKSLREGEHILSDALIEEAMVVKRLFLGGSENVITKSDLARTLEVLPQLEAVFLELRPHINILLARGESRRDVLDSEVSGAEAAIAQAARQLFALFQTDQNGRYEFSNLSRLVFEVGGFIARSRPETRFRDLNKYVPLLGEIKALLLHSRASGVDPDEWMRMSEISARTVSLFLRLSIGFRGLDVFEFDELKLNSIEGFVSSAEALLNLAFMRREGRPVPLSDFGKVFLEAEAVGLLSEKFGAVELRGIWRWFTDDILSFGAKDRALMGLTPDKVRYLLLEVRNWVAVERALREGQSGDWTGPARVAWAEMQAILDGPWALSLDAHGRLLMGDGSATTNTAGQSRLNLERAVLSLLFKGYSKEGLAVGGWPAIRASDLAKAYIDLHPALVAIGLADKSDTLYHAKIFRDANLFMYRSDGDETLSFFEAVEYIHHIFTGLSAGVYVYERLPVDCLIGVDQIRDSCFRRELKEQISDYFAHMPLLLEYVNSLTGGEWATDLSNLETSVRDDVTDGVPFKKSDLYEMFVFLQYVEGLLLRFDQNQNGSIDLQESLVAFEQFKVVLGGLVGFDPVANREDLLALFTYLLKYGVVPGRGEPHPLEQLRFLHWKWLFPDWDLDTRRNNVFVVLAALKRL
jgi:hypothetical protein